MQKKIWFMNIKGDILEKVGVSKIVHLAILWAHLS